MTDTAAPTWNVETYATEGKATITFTGKVTKPEEVDAVVTMLLAAKSLLSEGKGLMVITPPGMRTEHIVPDHPHN